MTTALANELNEDNLPAPLTPEDQQKLLEKITGFKIAAPLPTPVHFGANADPQLVKEDNAKHVSFQLQVLHQAWDYAFTLKRALALLKEQRDVIKFRADALGLPYGAKSESTREPDFTPIAGRTIP